MGELAEVSGKFVWGLDVEVDVEHADHKRD